MTIIALDVETTGLKPEEGHRIVEIGMVELDERQLQRTGRLLHKYVNPECPMSDGAYEVHGLGDDFLKDKPVFSEIAEELLEFVGDCSLLAHNAMFDLGFLNAELAAAGFEKFHPNRIHDSLRLAREELPQLTRFSLDALCRHFKIDNSGREKHGALLDAELLADVYFCLLGGNQDLFTQFDNQIHEIENQAGAKRATAVQRPATLAPLLTEEEDIAHREAIKQLGEDALWNRWL